MNEILLYIGKSTLCLSILYGVFYVLLAKEDFFTLNRRILIAIIILSIIIPLTYMPKIYTPEVSVNVDNMDPFVSVSTTRQLKQRHYLEPKIETYDRDLIVSKTQVITEVPSYSFSLLDTVGTLYLIGFIITFLVSIIGIGRTIALVHKSKTIKKDGYSLLVTIEDIPAFSFCRYVVISKNDYQNNKEEILTHEKSHVRSGHSLDLLLLMFLKIIYWFNPLVYLISRNLKEIHEYQADEYTIKSGVNALKYQRLIIQKSVGFEQFALANSFHHCQIKKRIAMINKKQTSKIWKWKAAAFIPVACMLLMSFSHTIEKVEIKSSDVVESSPIVDGKHWTESDFIKIDEVEYKRVKSKNLIIVELDDDDGVIVYRYRKGAWSSSMRFPYSYNEDFLVETTQMNTEKLRNSIDYKYVNKRTKIYFNDINIQGIDEKVSSYFIVIKRDPKVSDKEYQEVLDLVGNTILNIRNDYSQERYSKDFSQLKGEDKSVIEKLIPLRVYFKEEDSTSEYSVKMSRFLKSKDAKVLSLVEKNLVFLFNRYTKIWINGHIASPTSNNRTRYIQRYFDYEKADKTTKKFFKQVSINGKQLMAPTSNLYIYQEIPMNKEDRQAKVQDFVDLVQKIFFSIKDRYSNYIYSKGYSNLSLIERKEIDALLPNNIIADDKLINLEKGIKVVRNNDIICILEGKATVSEQKAFMERLPYNRGLRILINQYSYLNVNGKVYSHDNFHISDTFSKYKDYSRADRKTKKFFKSVLINGKQIMVSCARIEVLYDSKAQKTFIDLVSKLNKSVNRLKDKLSNQIYNKSYSQLTVVEKEEMDSLISMKINLKKRGTL